MSEELEAQEIPASNENWTVIPAADFNPDDFLNSLANPQTTDDPFEDTTTPPKTDDGLLSTEEKRKALEAWNSGATDLKSIIQAACGTGIDGRSKKGTAVKKYLADQNLKARPSHVYVKRGASSIVLTDSQKEFVANNAASMKPLEITRVLFEDGMLSALSGEFRAIKEYYDSLDIKVKAQTKDEETKEYNPPRNEIQALARINKYVFEALDPTKLTPRHRECIQRLIRFMHTHRYLFEMNSLPKNTEREIYESSFVRFVHDKPDLTEEEIDLYLNQCADIVGFQRMQLELTQLTQARDESMATDQKMPMPLVEAIGKLRSDMADNFKRQKSTLNDLNGKRSNRLEKINASSESVLKLIEAFRDETERAHMIRILENRKKLVTDEIKRLETIEDYHAHLFGVTKEEVS